MYHSPFVQPPLTNVGSSFERFLGIFQDRGVILIQATSFPGPFPHYSGRELDFQVLFVIQNGGHVKIPTLGICRTIKIPTLGTDLTVKAPWVARSPLPPHPPSLGLNIDRCMNYIVQQEKMRDREGGSGRWPGYVISTKVIF